MNNSSKLKVKLIALDLDDTLLNKDCNISPETVKAIKKATEQEIYIVLCSGRATNGVIPFVNKLGLSDSPFAKFIITTNGARIFNLHTNEKILEKNTSPEVLKTAYRKAREMNIVTVVYSEDTVYSEVDNEFARMDSKLCSLNFEVVPDFENFLNGKFPKMLVSAEPERILELKEQLYPQLKDSADLCLSKPFFLEVLSKDISKGNAILHLADYLNIPHSQTMAFGDSMNDETMIRQAGYGVAMCNGLDYIKNIADFVTEKDNNHDGIADFLYRYVLA